MQPCVLCGKNSGLKVSHIIPKFVGRWIKRTSLFGKLRQMAPPYDRQQDLYKLPLLCDSCEKFISKFEDYFARNVFYRLNKNYKALRKIELMNRYCIKYDAQLLKFIISLSLKNLFIHEPDYFCKSVPEKTQNQITNAITDWKSFILTGSPITDKWAHYLIFWYEIPLSNPKEQIPTEWYLRRGTDVTVASNEDHSEVFVYSHLPSISLISAIEPKYIIGWEDAEVFDQGVLLFPQDIMPRLGFHFKDFILSRVRPFIDFMRLKKKEGYHITYLKKYNKSKRIVYGEFDPGS